MVERLSNYTEQPSPSESMGPKPKYDALLMHCYWMTQKGRHTAPALRTHFAVRAAVAAWDEGKGAGKIVVDGGHWWGPGYPSQGALVKNLFVNKYHVPPEAIIVREDAYSTGGEVQTMVELARENGWTNILDVSSRWHRFTIGRLFKGSGLNVKYDSIQHILKNEDKRIKRKLSGLGRARPLYPVYELGKWILMHKPGFNYASLEETNRHARSQPGQDVKGFPIQIIDVARLPEKVNNYSPRRSGGAIFAS